MKYEKFQQLWDTSSSKWYDETQVIDELGEEHPATDFCRIEKDYSKKLYKRYIAVKRVLKEEYYHSEELSPDPPTLSRFRRAAVLAYIINESEPLRYFSGHDPDKTPYYLKQRLAFHVALASILCDYKKEDIDAISGPIYEVPELKETEIMDKSDDFYMSIYKDLYFSEKYRNYNILTMANLIWVLTEKSSKLKDLKPLPPHHEPST